MQLDVPLLQAQGRIRTGNLPLSKRALCPLSYLGTTCPPTLPVLCDRYGARLLDKSN
jgi:hypothetical protein